jgi:hypothetical protein
LGLDEATLPLGDLSGINVGDALRIAWPKADAIVGNPPFHGSQNMRREFGDDYVGWLARHFGIGVKDYCVYWFRLAHDQLGDGQRAGLVGTNSISQNRMRKVSLNYIAENGGVITDAVSRQKWPGAAVVNVSIVNWVKNPDSHPTEFMLDGVDVEGISTRLAESTVGVEEFEALAPNRRRCFQGPIPGGDFYLSHEQANEMLSDPSARYSDVVVPYLNGDDITEDPRQEPGRWVIDFGNRRLEDAMTYPAALERVRAVVKPERDQNRRKTRRERWWMFAERAVGLRRAVAGLPRFIAVNAQGKRFLFTWQDAKVCPSNLVYVFAFSDDYAMGVISSGIHRAWALKESSTLEDRPRYTPSSAFDPFPWPDPGPAIRDRIGELAGEIVSRRQQIATEREIGLTELYNQVDEGAWQGLAKLHADLDAAVAEAYGWPRAVSTDPLEMVRRLTDLHGSILTGDVDYHPF